jgi:hypothetical protein
MKEADISSLVGRSYVTQSGVRCTLSKLGNGALRVNWASRESQVDRNEVNEWISSVLKSQGIDAVADVCEDVSKEAERYAAFKKRC